MQRFNNFYKSILEIIQTLYRIARGADYKLLNDYIIKINQAQDIDSIIHQTCSCLQDILKCRFFALAVYNRDLNGGVDVWTEPEVDNLEIISLIKKDYSFQDLYYNVRHLGKKDSTFPVYKFDPKTVLSFTVMDNTTRIMLYMVPGTTLQHYHQQLMEIVFSTISTAISNLFNLKKLKNAAFIDPLTHCYNRRALDEHIEHDLASTERHGSELSIFMIDIDHFKNINDTYGHSAGDIVLQSVAKCIHSAIRRGDYLARYGGEEFMIVLPDTKLSKAIELAERLRKMIENSAINIDNKTIRVTASFGIATYRKKTSKAVLFQKADEMLYKSKTRGRNRITPNLRLHPNTSSGAFASFLKDKSSLRQ